MRLVTDAPLAHLAWDGPSERPPVLLLHGIGGGRGSWGEVAPRLAARGRRVIAPDFPGYGLTPPVEPCDLAHLADSVLRLLDHLGADQAVLVGHSMGGMVAQELMARAPQRVAGLGLVSTSPAFGRADDSWQREFLASRFAPLDAGLGMAGLAARLVPELTGPTTPPDVAEAAQALMAGVPEATYRAAVRALLPFDRRAALAAIHVPTVVVTGEHDRAASPEVARRMSERIPNAVLRIVPGAGHLLPIEHPQAFAETLFPLLD